MLLEELRVVVDSRGYLSRVMCGQRSQIPVSVDKILRELSTSNC